MKKTFICSLVFAVTLSIVIFNGFVTISSNIEEQQSRNFVEVLVFHEPITITHDGNFTDYGFSGLGTSEEPYLIENYQIITIDGKGIVIENTTKHFIIQNCEVEAYNYSIYLKDNAEGTAMVTNSKCTKAKLVGIYLYDSDGSEIINNTCNDNFRGIYVEKSSDVKLIKNSCNNFARGIELYQSLNAIITENRCTDNSYGIQLIDSDYALLEENICNENKYGFYFTSSAKLQILNNTLNFNENGIVGYDLFDSAVMNNYCQDNNEIGIDIAYSSDVIIENNNCQNNKHSGFILSACSNSIVTKNTCKYNRRGIRLGCIFFPATDEIVPTSSCLITFNIFQQNVEYGVTIGEYEGVFSYNITIHHNSFIGNNREGTSQGYDEGRDNFWFDKDKQEGNYWSEWDSKKPYIIDGIANSTDLYPLNENLETINFEFVMFIPSFILVVILIRRKIE